MQKGKLRVLNLEDSPNDSELIEAEFAAAFEDVEFFRVQTRAAFTEALEVFKPDVILCDYKLPDFDGLTALKIVRQTHPELPVIIVTGAMSDIHAVELIHAGAKDYVLKDRLARLVPSVLRVLSEEEGIRARKASQKALQESETKYRAIFESVRDIIYVLDQEGRFVSINPVFQTVTGFAPDEWIGRSFHHLIHPDDLSRAMESFRNTIAKEGSDFSELRILQKSGNYLDAELSSVSTKLGDSLHLLGVARDISERKNAEKELHRFNRALRTISSCNEVLIHANDEHQLLNDMCQVVVKQAGYVHTWVGFVEHNEQKTVRHIAHAGFEDGELEQFMLTWAETANGFGPAGTAIRTQKPALVKDTLNDPTYLPWRQHGIRLGYLSVIALPLVASGNVLGVLAIYSPDIDGFSAEEIKLLDELSDDLAFGIESVRIRHLQVLTAQRLMRSMEGSIAAMATTVEMRDPYTAGHQHRVAELSKAIAHELGLPEEEAHGIYLAAEIHDLGKVQVPAEILSNPGKLGPIQRQMVQAHAQAGFDILKDIDFPWPIAQMVYQHHECLDGSGYPNGLKDGEILFGAKIIAVADVVEAMSSHRPYRPGLGIEAALEEVSRMRGVRYDATVVDACITLFRERGYSLPAAWAAPPIAMRSVAT